MGSCAEKKSDLYMENLSTTCNVRVKRCSTPANTGNVSSAEERSSGQGSAKNPDSLCPPKRSSCSDNQCSNGKTGELVNACCVSELRPQNNGAMKAVDGPGDDTSCVSGLDATNTVVESSSDDAERKNNESGSSASVNSFPPPGKAFNDSQNVLHKTSRNTEELIYDNVERSVKGSGPCAVDSSKNPPLGELLCKVSDDSSNGPAEAQVSELSETNECKEKQLLSTDQTCRAELPIPSESAAINCEFTLADDEVRVCDICGDVGREHLLAICTKCNDGAEHIYCMRVKMDKVPGGDWVCEDCEIKVEPRKVRDKKVEEEAKLLKRSYSMNSTQKSGSSGLFNLKKRLKVDTRASALETKTANSVSCSPKLPLSKLSSGNSAFSPMSRKRSTETHYEIPNGAHLRKTQFQDRSSSSSRNVTGGKIRPFPSGGLSRTTFSVEKSRLLKSKSFNLGDTQAKDRREQHGIERRSICKDLGKGVQSKTLCKSQSFKHTCPGSLVPDISKAKKMPSPASPRVDDRIRGRQTGDHTSSPRKLLPKFGSSNADYKRNALGMELPPKPSAAVNCHDQETIQGRERFIDSAKSISCTPQKGSQDQHEENAAVTNNVKEESSCKDNQLDVKRSSRRHYLDCLVPSPRGFIPQVDFIWKGGFEVSKSEGITTPFPCIQAHKSNCACDKVDDAVMKFPQTIVLVEAPRLSSWPTQFKDTPAMEDNVALFFFAETLESYEAYKSLLEHISVNDLALKGCLEGVELLIFSSKVLPPESQRWNSLLYLWGVFRTTSWKSPEEEITFDNPVASSPGHCTNFTSLQTLNSNGLPLASPTRVHEISERMASSSGPKFLPLQAIDRELGAINSSTISLPGEETDFFKSRQLDLQFGRDSNTGYPGPVDEKRPDRKMKGVVYELPDSCSQKLFEFLEARPVFYSKDRASSSGTVSIDKAAIAVPRDDERSTPEDVNLELSLEPVSQPGKRKALSLSFGAVDDSLSPVKRLRKDETELSLSLSLSLAPPP